MKKYFNLFLFLSLASCPDGSSVHGWTASVWARRMRACDKKRNRLKYFVLLLLLSCSVNASDPLTVRENNSAVKLIEKDRTMEAQKKLQRSVVDHARQGEFHYNLAQTYEKNENFDDAIKEYQAAAQLAKDNDLKFNSTFNAARLYGEKKDIPSALQNYQAALELKPDSVETKTNIEILMKQGGGGGGSGQQQSKSQGDKQDEGDGEENKQSQNPGQQPQQQKSQQGNQPRPFESKELSKADVKKIFEEVQRQDDKIRGKILEKKVKEPTVGKDW